MTALAHYLFPAERGARAVVSLIAAGLGAVSAVLSVVLVIVSH